ncbi:MAG: ABC transporter substrate-binding protein [Bacteroidota bacterium]
MTNRLSTLLLLIMGFLLLISCSKEESKNETVQEDKSEEIRLISLSGFLTETLFELGMGESIIGRDITSTYPVDKVADIPSLGHVSKLNMEAILSLNPQWVLLESSQLKQAQELEKLEQAGIKILSVPSSHSLGNAYTAASFIADKMDIPQEDLAGMQESIVEDSLALMKKLEEYGEDKPRVLFIYARGAGRLMVGGNNTSASAIIEKAGGVNAIQSFDNFQALTPESLVEASPDVILMFTSGIASLDGKEGLGTIPGVAQTPAYKNDKIVAMDGHYLTAFGPRAGKAALELAEAIHK